MDTSPISEINCFLAGEDHLLIQCAEILIANKFILRGIVSPLRDVKLWTKEKNIPHYTHFDETKNCFEYEKIDYLFSIVNSQILPDFLLTKLKKFAINYHDAPLPRYAGVNATCWAIMNGESNHGVSWHVVTDVVDAGDILKQASFEVQNEETTLSLNLKCYNHGLNLFKELAEELASGTYKRSKQDLSQRTFYQKAKKPKGNGLINWEISGEELDRQFRASQFGRYKNPLSVLKFKLDDNFYIVKDLKLTNEKYEVSAGRLIDIDESYWKISTSTFAIILLEITTLQGQQCHLLDLARKHSLTKDETLFSFSLGQQEHFKILSESIFKYEHFWVETLSRFRASEIPFLITSPESSDEHISFRLFNELELNGLLEQKNHILATDLDFIYFSLTIFLIYLHKLGNNHIGISLNIPEVRKLCLGFRNVLNKELPFSLELKDEFSFEESLKLVKSHYNHLKDKLTYTTDVFSRYPALSEIEHYIPIMVFIEDEDTYHDAMMPNSAFILKITPKEKKLQWLLNKAQLDDNLNLIKFASTIKFHTQNLIDNVCENKKNKIKSLSLLSKIEKSEILAQVKNNKSEYPKNKAIHQIFEEQVSRYSKNIAVSDSDSQLTYFELNKKSNQLARFLIKKGLEVGDFVIIIGESTSDFLISVLAVLKAGGVYIPIDLHSPSHKIEAIINDASPKLLLLKEKHTKILESFLLEKNSHCMPLFIEEAYPLCITEKIENLDTKLNGNDLAYIMYTSGTTGAPKGVMIPHCAISRLVKKTNYINIVSEDKIAQASSISFDASTLEIWGALLNGAQLVCVPRTCVLNPVQFSDFLLNKSITILWLTSALFDQCATTAPQMFKYLNYLIVGGDVLNPEKIKTVLECSEGSPQYIVNGYGPTENTTFTATFLIKQVTSNLRIPIGTPINNTFVYVLDEHLDLVPMGISGELYVGGDGLAQGYLNKIELSEEKFINSPFDPKEKLYQTGDIVRWLPDGNLDYLGRKDNQVKIRGFRIELEAVQIQLLKHPSVKQALVLVHEDSKRRKCLVAYMVLNPGADTYLTNIKEFLLEHLPSHMIPHSFYLVSDIPLNENGKIDKKLLASCARKEIILNNDYVEPTNLVEKSIAKMWSILFSNKRIGIHDDFFKLGGDSLLLTNFILDLNNQFDFDIPLSLFLKNPTVSYIATLITNNDEKSPQKITDIISKDTVLDPKIRPIFGSISLNSKRSVFLTGATGFLGIHLLNHLHQQENTKIYCLVRAQSEQDALQSIEDSAKKCGLNLLIDDRIVPVLGDLSMPNLGLTQEIFQALSKEVEVIYHNGAYVHHMYHYEMLRAANVLGTIELLKMASQYRTKSFHYVSTLSAVFDYTDTYDFIIEDFLQSDSKAENIPDGYSQTKWASEKLLAQAATRGVPVNIYRPGWILGDSQAGHVLANKNHLLLLIQGCICMGYAPDWEGHLSILPVDFISKFIVDISNHQQEKSYVYNLSNSNLITWIELVRFLNEYGYKVEIIPEHRWINEHLMKIDKENSLFNLLPLYFNTKNNLIADLDKICKANDFNTRNAMVTIDVSYPTIDRTLLFKYFSFIEKTFLAKKRTSGRDILLDISTEF